MPPGTLYLWKVRCLDRDTKELFDRELLFEPPESSRAEEVAQAISILSGRPDNRLIVFRHLFREVSSEEAKSLIGAAKCFSSFCLPYYFEDRNGNQLDEIDLVGILSGQQNPVIVGDPRSIVRLGPSDMLDKGEWSIQDSNDAIHLTQTVAMLQRSRWLEQPVRISSSECGKYSLVNPDIDSITAALALVRQFLLPRDNIFRTATEIYMRHVGDERKRIWVNEEYRRFDSFLESSPSYFTTELTGRIKGLTNRELIEIFIYGSGLFHRASNQNMEDRLMDLYMNCPREPLVFAFHSSCIEMLRAPFAVSPVIYQDLAYWIHSGWCPRPTRMVISRLFAST